MKKLVVAFALIGMSSSAAFANTYKTECRLVGAHMTPTLMLTIGVNESTSETQIVEQDMSSNNVLEVKSGQFELDKGWVRKGETDVFVSKATNTTYKIVALEESKDLGSWQTKPVDDHCAPYGDLSTSTSSLEISMIKDSKVVAKKNVLMVCESSGRYHGYYGTPGCPGDEK